MEDQQQTPAGCSCELDSENSDTPAGTCPEGTCYGDSSTETKDAGTHPIACQGDISWAGTPEPTGDIPSDSVPSELNVSHSQQGSDKIDQPPTNESVANDESRTFPDSPPIPFESRSSAKSSPIRLPSSPVSSPKKTESSETEAVNCSSSKSDMDKEGSVVESIGDSVNCSSPVTDGREEMVDSPETIASKVSNTEVEEDNAEEDEEEVICRLGEETSSMHSAIEELSSPSPTHSKTGESPVKSQELFDNVSPVKTEEDSDFAVTPESHEEFVATTQTENASEPLDSTLTDDTSVPNALSISTVSDSVPSDSGVSGVTSTTEDVSTRGDTDAGEYTKFPPVNVDNKCIFNFYEAYVGNKPLYSLFFCRPIVYLYPFIMLLFSFYSL